MSFSEYMRSSTGNPIVDAEKYTNKPVSIDDAGKCIQNAKSYTREELVEVMAEALWGDHKNELGQQWYAESETWRGTSSDSQRAWRQSASAALAALEAIDAVKIKEGE